MGELLLKYQMERIMKLRYELLALTISAIFLINCAGIDEGPTQYEDLNKIKSIVSKNPDKINELDEYGNSYLHLSVREGNIEIVEFLISQGAEVNIKDSLGVTPLQVAARAGRLEIVEYLLSKGAKVGVKDHTGITPLHDAVIKEHIQIVKILVSHGANINTADSGNQTALHDAIMLKNIEISDFLLTKGANVNTKNDQGRSPLHDAANSGNLSLVKELVDRGAGVNTKDKYEGLPLHYASREGYLAIVKYLISKGSNINDRGAFYLQRGVWELTLGCTPLHISASQGHLDVVKYLITQGADVSAKNNDGETALVLARRNENENVADYLAFLERKVQSSMSDLEDNTISERKSVISDEQKTIKSIMAKLDFGRYTALIIGNNNYEHLPSLKTAQNDTKEVAKILKEKYGFTIKILLDAKRSDILLELNNLRRDLTNQDNLLIYYAGHGWLDKEADEGYWLPIDAEKENMLAWVSNSSITASIRALKAKHVLVIADSCFSGKLARGIHIVNKTPGYLYRLSQKKARCVISSGGLEPVIDSGGKGDHSVFASAFLDALIENNGIMDSAQLFNSLRRPVMLNSDQTPEYSDIRKAGHEGGEFLFVPLHK